MHDNIFMSRRKQTKKKTSQAEVNKKMQNISALLTFPALGRGVPGEMTHVYPKQANYSAYDSWP